MQPAKTYRNPEITRCNYATYMYAVFATIMAFVFLPAMQPYVLTDIHRRPEETLGTDAGNLLFADEVVVISTIFMWTVFLF